MSPKQWEHVKGLYEAALERTPVQRTAFLQDTVVELGFPFFSVLPNNYECDVTLSGYLVKFLSR